MERTVYIAEPGQWNKKPTSNECNYKFLLELVRWNDFGFYTHYKLYRIVPGTNNIFIANMKCFNGTSPNSKLFYYTDIRSFLLNVESAYRFLLFLSYEERMELITELHIGSVDESDLESKIFKDSILRNITRDDFLVRNENIMKIINEEIDFLQIMKDNKKSIETLIS